MSHLSIDRLAALADEQPTSDEQNHLNGCESCRREIEAHRSLLAMAGTERDAMSLPLTRWDTLSERLRAEGLIAKPDVGRSISSAESHSRYARFASRAPLQIAAALLLVAGGVLLGRVSTGGTALPGITDGDRSAQTAVRTDSVPATFASVDEAVRMKDFYAAGYQNALSYLANNDSSAHPSETPAVMKTRLAALNQVSRAMREAMNDAPYDPVINDFYLNSSGQFNATLRQINTALPQGAKLNSF